MNIIHLYGRYWYDQKMSIGRLLYGEAVGRYPGVNLMFSGKGWPGWNDKFSVEQNISDIGFKPDFLWVYKGADYPTLKDCRVPKLVVFNEAHHEKTIEEIEAADASLIGFHHDNDAPRWAYLPQVMFTLPHCCDIDEQAKPHSERPVFCLAAGVRSERIYPLRCRMMSLVESGQIPGVIRKHPGYRLTGNQNVRRQYEEYRAAIRSARIALCCSSVFRYPLAKYVEAAAAGCLIVGDMPDDGYFRESLGRHIVEVPANAPDAVIIDTVRYWLTHTEQAQEMAAAALDAVRCSLTTRHYAERIVSSMDRCNGTGV